MSTGSVYEQRILSGRVFRLLFIHPAQHQDQQLRCSCLPFTIDTAPPFEALSYVWGCRTPTFEVLCNGQPFPIQPELKNALLRLRLHHETRIVWADAICINQGDIQERNHQVSLMGSIYPSAKRVIVWLGLADPEHTGRAFDLVELIGSGFDPPIRLFTTTVCASLAELFGRSWFTRIWCVQEICLAHDALVLCGKHEVSWKKLGLTASWISDKTTVTATNERLERLLRPVHNGPAEIVFKNERNSLLWTLNSGSEYKSTDLRDKVYGLLGLVNPKAEAQAIDIDYHKSVGDVYADTVVAIIRLYSRLSAFAFVSHPPDYDGVTGYRSWAPRWDNEEPAVVFGYPENGYAGNADGHAVSYFTDETQPTPVVIHLKGVLYDTVLEVFKTMDFNLEDEDYDYSFNDEQNQELDDMVDDRTDDMHRSGIEGMVESHTNVEIAMATDTSSQVDETHPFLEIFNRMCCGPHEDAQKRLLIRTMTAGTYDDAHSNPDGTSTDRYFEAFEHVMHRLSQLDRCGTDDNCTLDENSKMFEVDAIAYCRQRRIFLTRKGDLGLGPQCMRVNDVVVVLYGGNTPYVLRPRGDEFLFIGQAYIDKIMHGEVIEDLRAGEVHEQTFSLI